MAATVRHAIIEQLRLDAELLDLLATPQSIYYRVAPQTARFPLVVLFKQAGRPEYTFADHHDDELWTVKAVSREHTPEDAEAIDERLRAVLHDAPLDIEGYALLYCRREQDIDYGEIEEGAVIHHIGATYRIYKEPA